MIVEFSFEAERDLEEIGDRIARDDPTRASTFVDELIGDCLGLVEFPERFALVPRYERHGVRHRVHGNYLIFYRIEAQRIIVIHVLHGAMDYADLLFPD